MVDDSLRWVSRKEGARWIVVVVGGPGSLKGALIGSLLIGFVDTFGKVFFPELALITIYAAMALILIFKPGGMYSRL